MIKGFLKINNYKRLSKTVNMATWLRFLIGISLSVLSGIMLTIAFPPFNMWYLVFIALIPVTLAQYRILPEKFSSLASAVMNAVFVGVYFGPLFYIEGVGFNIMQLLPFAVFALSYFGDKSIKRFHEQTGYNWFVIYAVSNWIFFEFVRTFIPGLGTWGFVGYTLWSQQWFIFPIAMLGIYALDFVVIFFNYALAQLFITFLDKKYRFDKEIVIPLGKAKLELLLSILLIIAWGIAGLILKSERASDIAGTPSIKVAAIQHGLTEVAFSNPNMDKEERLNLLIELTRRTKSENPRIISWPELVLNFDPEEEFTEELVALAKEMDAYIGIPYGIVTDNMPRNEIKIVTPQGEFLPVYGKAHPVTFGGEVRGPNSGKFPVHELDEFNLASMICFDLNFTDVGAIYSKKGAQIVLIPSNDWPQIAQKQNHHLIFRAIEGNYAIVKAETAFDSAIVSPLGEILASTESLTPKGDILIEDVKLGGSKPTIYSLIGDVVGIILSIAGVLFMFIPDYVKKEYKKILENR